MPSLKAWIAGLALLLVAACGDQQLYGKLSETQANEMVAVLANRYYGAVPRELPAGYSNTKALGRVLYTQYAFAFEVAAVLLLVAIVAAIALTLRKRKDSRYQDPSIQVRVRRGDRVRLVSMKVEK